MNPRGRRDQLLVEELPGELLVYDLVHNKAHCLNQTASFVWQQCDGATSVPEIAARLPRELGLPADDALVWLALAQLGRAGLLHDQAPPTGRKLLGRRDLIRKLGLTGSLAMLLPLVSTAMIPAAAEAASNPCTPPDCKCQNLTPPEATDCCQQVKSQQGKPDCRACCDSQFGPNGTNSKGNSIQLLNCMNKCNS
jgi:Coenzyme PQQ synthesis protein D (PqqD)